MKGSPLVSLVLVLLLLSSFAWALSGLTGGEGMRVATLEAEEGEAEATEMTEGAGSVQVDVLVRASVPCQSLELWREGELWWRAADEELADLQEGVEVSLSLAISEADLKEYGVDVMCKGNFEGGRPVKEEEEVEVIQVQLSSLDLRARAQHLWLESTVWEEVMTFLW